jgi:hypothetical protein
MTNPLTELRELEAKASPGPRLTKTQMAWLAKVCATSGGGMRIKCRIGEDDVVRPTSAPLRRLFDLHLIQGKSGAYETVVHTRAGWEMYRTMLESSTLNSRESSK